MGFTRKQTTVTTTTSQNSDDSTISDAEISSNLETNSSVEKVSNVEISSKTETSSNSASKKRINLRPSFTRKQTTVTTTTSQNADDTTTSSEDSRSNFVAGIEVVKSENEDTETIIVLEKEMTTEQDESVTEDTMIETTELSVGNT